MEDHNRYDNIEREIDQTLESLDNWKHISASPFFYQRFQTRMDQGMRKINPPFWDQPWLRVAVVTLFLLINLLHWAILPRHSQNSQAELRTEEIKAMGEEFFGSGDLLDELISES